MSSLLRYGANAGTSLTPYRFHFFRSSLLVGLLSLLSWGLFAQNPRYVTPNGAGSRSGSTWSNALSGTALQGVLASAPAGTTFLVGTGLYKPTFTTARTISFSIPSGVEVYGGYEAGTTTRTTNPSSTTLSGDIDNDNTLANNSYKVVQTSGSNVVLDGLLITQGDNRTNEGGFLGGGLLANGGSLTLRRVQFINNAAIEGGGMLVQGGSANLINCFFGQNISQGSGGLQFLNVMSSSVTSCSFIGNSAQALGGAIYNNNSNPSITNCSFFGNSANRGGAISNLSSSPTLTNCSFSGNSSGMGAIHVFGNGSNPTLTNCIIWGNSTSGVVTESGVSVTYRYTDSQDGVQPGEGNLSVDPRFVNAATGNLRLQSCSPLINVGDNTVSAGTTDLMGNPRRNGIIDLGAYEFQGINPINYVTPSGAGLADGSSWTNALSGTALQGALATACASTTFLVGAGLYKPTTGTDRTVSFTIPSGVQVYGGYAGSGPNPDTRTASPSSTTFSGDIGTQGINMDNSYRVVLFVDVSPATRLDGVVITKGTANGPTTGPLLYFAGGGILNRVQGNGNSNSTPTLVNLSLVDNSALNGGGLYNLGNSRNSSSSPVLINVSFINNTVSGNGGGMYNNGLGGNSSPFLTNVSFINNSAGNIGGAMYNVGSNGGICRPVLTNVSFSSNTAINAGGAIFSDQASLTLTNGVVFGNGAGSVFAGGTLTATYSLFEEEVSGYINGGNNLTTTTSPFVSSTNLQLNSCATAINTGNTSAYTAVSGPPTDLVGNPRIFPTGGIIDRGAYEFQGTSTRLGIIQQPPNGTAVCVGATVTATVSVTGSSPTFQWYKDGVSLSAQQSATLTLPNVTTAQTGSYSVVATGTCNSVTSTAFNLTVNPLPTPTLTSSGTITCAQTSVTLTAGGGSSYAFSGPGILSQNPTSGTALVSGGGLYSVTVTSASGCASTTSLTVDQNTAPASVSITPTSATITCSNPVVSLTAVGVGSYRWSTGETTSSISVTAGVAYSVTLTGTNGCTAVATRQVDQDTTSPTVSIAPARATLTCGSPVVSLSVVGNGSYQWSTGASTQSISVSTATTYSVTLTATNGCKASASAVVGQDTTPPTVSINPSSATLTCSTPAVSLSASGNGTYRWSTGETTPTISVSAGGSYSLVVTGANGCSATAVASVSVDQTPPSVAISPRSATLTCTTPVVSLSAVGVGAYRWSTGNISPTISVSTAGTYSLTVTAANGCSASASTPISLDNTPPQVSIAPASATLTCNAPTVSLSALGSGSYRWSTGATTASISVSVANTYSVTLTGANGCSSTASAGVIYQNCAPTVASPIPPQSATIGEAYSYTIPATTFTDPEMPNSLTLAVVGLPAGLSFVSPNLITGIPSTTVGTPFSVTVIATDPGGLSASTNFLLHVQSRGFAITGVTMLDCNHISYFERRINFTVSFEGTTGQPISLSVVNEAMTIAINEPFQLNLFTDNPVIVFKARQQGTPGEASFAYNWLAFCANGNPRVENAIPSQSATVGQAFSYTLPANTFTDAETPNSLSLSVIGLPAGLSFVAPRTITGIASGSATAFYSVTVTATDPAGGSISTILPFSVVNPGGCGSMFSLKAGDWNDPAVWSCGRLPLITDAVTLNHAVSLPPTYQGQALRVIYSATGRLVFGASSWLRLGGN